MLLVTFSHWMIDVTFTLVITAASRGGGPPSSCYIWSSCSGNAFHQSNSGPQTWIPAYLIRGNNYLYQQLVYYNYQHEALTFSVYSTNPHFSRQNMLYWRLKDAITWCFIYIVKSVRNASYMLMLLKWCLYHVIYFF